MYGVGRLVCRRTTVEELRIHLSCEGDDEKCYYKIESRLIINSYCIKKEDRRHATFTQKTTNEINSSKAKSFELYDGQSCLYPLEERI
jgi:uncharacterized protein (UPF0371 family)